ncbi:MAG: twin-arginine translocation signal domain-containing protein [Candidatus Nanohalobium sp.]
MAEETEDSTSNHEKRNQRGKSVGAEDRQDECERKGEGSKNIGSGLSKDDEEQKSVLSRRNFLKLLGMGAGSLALSSSVAGLEWSVFQPASSGQSDVNADEVDGHDVHVGSSAPSNPETNDIWIDTS